MVKKRSKRTQQKQAPILIAFYKSEQWSRLREISLDAELLDERYEDWLYRYHEKKFRLEYEKVDHKSITIDVEELLRWCRENGQLVNEESRDKFLHYINQKEGKFGFEFSVFAKFIFNLVLGSILMKIIGPLKFWVKLRKLFLIKKIPANFVDEVIRSANNIERYQLLIKRYKPELYQNGDIFAQSVIEEDIDTYGKFFKDIGGSTSWSTASPGTIFLTIIMFLPLALFRIVAWNLRETNRLKKELFADTLTNEKVKTDICRKLSMDEEDISKIAGVVTEILMPYAKDNNSPIVPDVNFFATCAYLIKLAGVANYCRDAQVIIGKKPAK